LVSLLEKGIGIHHSGMIPVLREIVELMISKKYIKLLFATESFAIGLDCPIRTAIFTSLTKFDGNGERYLHAHEYSQMKGRAGRRGIDTVGHVIHLNNLFKLPVMSEYKAILSGKPQQLISKFHISYALILNLLKNGQKTNFHTFSEKSMIYTELIKSINIQEKYITELTEKANAKRVFIDQLKTPYATCVKVISIEGQLKTLANKKKKDAERELRAIQDEYRTLNEDLKQAKDFMKINGDLDNESVNLQYMRSFVTDQTNTVCQVLLDDGFIAIDNAGKHEYNTTAYELTSMGIIASNIAEIHPLIMSKMLIKYDYFSELSVKQLIGVFSCFTDIKVPQDIKASVPHTDDDTVKRYVKEINEYCLYFEKREMENDMRTGIRYDELLNYDMIDFAMEWCDCENEYDCKYFIQNKVAEKSISVGDFNKALLKIVTIAKELANVCEIIGQIELKYKLSQIEGFVLKYVTTSQSLYL
jgi:superfamily II RNA helicase